MSDPSKELRDYLTWLAGYAAIPGDSAFDRRLKMARQAVDRIAALVAQARADGAAEERERIASEVERLRTYAEEAATLNGAAERNNRHAASARDSAIGAKRAYERIARIAHGEP